MKLTFLAALLALAACAPAPQPEGAMDPPSAAPPADVRGGPIPPRRFDDATSSRFRSQSGLAEAGQQVVRDAGAWSALWARITRGSGPDAGLPAVDFGREMVLVAAMGRRATGGYTVTIEAVDEAGGEWVARVAEQSPGPRCGTTQAVTAPADVVVVPRTDRPIRWAVRQVVHDCP
jgi:hypothetical protein